MIGMVAARREERRGWDIAAFLRGALVGLAIASLLQTVAHAAWGGAEPLSVLWIGRFVSVTCLVLGIGFIVVEARHHSPMLPLRLLGRRTLGPVALVGLFHNVAIYGLIFVLSLSLQHLAGFDPVGAGLLFLPLTVALAIGTRIGARVLRNHGPFGPLIWGHFAAAIGALVLALLAPELAPVALAPPLLVIGIGGGITTSAMNLAVLDSVARAQSGLASGILNTARQAGGVIGVALLGALLGEPATLTGVQAAEFVAAGALFVASSLALAASKGPQAPTG